jgi:TP901 family phage tail tape measure protein
MLEKLGIGAIFTFNEKPGVKGLRRAKSALDKFTFATHKGKTGLQFHEFEFKKNTRAANTFSNTIGGVAVRRAENFGRAMRRVGIILKGVRAGISKTGQILRKMVSSMRSGFNQISSGVRSVAIGMAPAGLALGLGVKTAADFEHQMSAVSAVTRANSVDMKSLKQEAERMGIVSMFSATQAGKGMEFLGRAGAKPHEIIAALQGTMNAAAADMIEMGTAADIIAGIVKSMGLEWGEAAHVADTLAFVSADAKTNIISLGESFTYAAPLARSLGIGFDELTGILGKLADANLRGSIGGTSLGNMLLKMSKKTEKAEEIMKKYNLTWTDANKKLKPISTIVTEVEKALSTLEDPTERSAAAIELFGLRGMKAYNALAASGKEATDTLIAGAKRSSDGIGVATEMANKRLDNLKGQLTLFKSSVEALAIKVLGPMLRPFSKAVENVRNGLNDVLTIFQQLNDAEREGTYLEARGNAIAKHGKMVVEIAEGFRDAVNTFRVGFEYLSGKIQKANSWFERTFGAEGVRKVVAVGTILLTVAGAVAPLLLSLMMVGFTLEGLSSIASGFGTIISGSFIPLLVVGGLLGVMFLNVRKEGESVEQTFLRMWEIIKTNALLAWELGIKPFISGILESKEAVIELGQQFSNLVFDVLALLNGLRDHDHMTTTEIKEQWKSVGKSIVSTLTTVLRMIIMVARIGIMVFRMLKMPVDLVVQSIYNIATAFKEMFSGNVMSGIARLGMALFDTLVAPLRLFLKGLTQLANLIGKGDLIPKGIQTFIDKGTTGLFFPEKTPKERRTNLLTGEKGPAAFDAKGGAGTSLFDDLYDSLTGFGKSPASQVLDIESERKSRLEESMSKMPEAIQNLQQAAQDLKDGKDVKLDITNQMCVDGEAMNVASSRHKTEVKERSGGKDTPWQRRVMMEQGAVTNMG